MINNDYIIAQSATTSSEEECGASTTESLSLEATNKLLAEFDRKYSNRLKTIYAHETSYEALTEKFLEGDSKVQSLTTQTPQALFKPSKVPTPSSYHPLLAELRSALHYWEAKLSKLRLAEEGEAPLTVKEKAVIQHTIIELRKDVQILINALKPPMGRATTPQVKHHIDVDLPLNIETVPKLIDLTLCSRTPSGITIELSPEIELGSDLHCLLLDLSTLIKDCAASGALPPLYVDILCLRTQGYSNKEIAEKLQEKEVAKGRALSSSFLSTCYCRTIPKILAKEYQRSLLLKNQSLPRRICGKCGQSLPEHPFFFSFDSKAHRYYSICRECRRTSR